MNIFRCGLVALWMATHLLQPPKTLLLETLVQTAKDSGYTEQGEMFSGKQLLLKVIPVLNVTTIFLLSKVMIGCCLCNLKMLISL